MKKELFKDIVGYRKEKLILERIVDVLNHQDKYKKIGSNIPNGLILYGKPGLGKTTFACNMLDAIENRKKYIVRKTKSDGEFMNHLECVFREAQENQPSILFLDDLDKYSEKDDSYNNEEFVAVQSLIDSVKNDDVFVIATANDKDVLPSSLLRPGRFDIHMEIRYPDEKDSYDIMKHFLRNKKIDKDVNIQNISYILERYSCASLEKACNQAGIYAAFKNKRLIGNDELLRAALELAYDTCLEDVSEDNKYIINTAYHEAGHALVGQLLEPGSVLYTTVADNNNIDTRGITKYRNDDNYWDDIQFMKNRIMTLLAGKAATEIVFHTCDTGANMDLHRAFDLAERLIDNYCMNDFSSWIRTIEEQSEKVKESKDINITKLITEYYDKTKELLFNHKSQLDQLAMELKNKKILFKDDICAIISNS